MARECAGDHFAEGGARRPVKVNLLSAYQTIVGNLLIAKDPRYLASTFDSQYRAALRIEQDWLNETCIKANLAEVSRRVVTDGLYATGMFKVSLATPCDAARLSWGITAGEPTVTCVDFDDLVFDVAARDLAEVTFIGHRYRCPLDVAKKWYGSKAKDLVGEDEKTYNEDGDDRIATILKGSYTAEEFEDHVDLWEIYLPRHGIVCTLSDQDVQGQASSESDVQALWEQNWVGPYWGPYIPLIFGRIPGVAWGKGPMTDLFELHLDTNNVHRKVNKTLRNIKEVTVFKREQSQDADELRKADHLSFVPMDRPEDVRPIVSGGQFVQGLLTAAETYRGLFDFLAGNLALLGGRQAQSKTATQDKILNANAGAGIGFMHGCVQSTMSRVGQSLLWYAHRHPELVMKTFQKIPGTKGITRTLYPAGDERGRNRGFELPADAVRLDPYSIRYRTPEERLAGISQVVDKLVPITPILQQQGIVMDANFLVETFAELMDEPRLSQLFKTRPVPGAEQGGATEPPHGKTLPSQTERTYTRRDESQPEGPEQGLAEMSPQDFGASMNGQYAGAA